jgi:fructokinase
MKPIDIVCLGELLIDFTPAGLSPAGMRLFEQNAGGAPGNVAVAMTRLGHSAAFVGKVGSDMNGIFLRRSLDGAGVDTAWLRTDPAAATSMAFVTLSEGGERGFSFVRDADTKLTADEIDAEVLSRAKIFHFGSLSLTHEPARTATLTALRLAREKGCIVSYDPNYRALLWPDEQTAADRMASVLDRVDILKVSEEELLLLTGTADIEAGGRALLSRGPSCVAVTQGAKGATVCLPSGCVHTGTFPGPVADTTGAGDAFTGGFLSQLLERGMKPGEITLELAEVMSRFAHAVATCCVSKRGGIPAMPGRSEVDNLLRGTQP